MRDTLIRANPPAAAVPEDLLVFQARMAANGIRVRLPNANGAFALPELLPISGDELARSIVDRRTRKA